MIDIITVNPLENFRSVKEDNDNFIICHSYVSDLLVTSKIKEILHYNVYYKDGMDSDDLENLQEMYASDDNMKFKFTPVSYISEALDRIANKISNRIDPDEDEDVQVVCAMEEFVAIRFVGYLNRTFRENGIECEAISLLRYTSIPNLKALTKTLKTWFNTEFIYPEEPMQFAHVCRAYIQGK